MRPAQRDRLISILAIQAKSRQTSKIRAYMKRALEEAGCTVEKVDHQLHARKGRADGRVPLYVAHADTVHPILPDDEYQVRMLTEKGDIRYFAFNPKKKAWTGVGGDDKCGLWVVLEAAHALDDMAAIITIDEEIGCVGAKKLTKAQLGHASILIQADRRGKDDAVRKTYAGTISSKEWQNHVENLVTAHGYRWCEWGASTDVAAILDSGASEVGAINLSAGYHRPHSAQEYVSEYDLENAAHLAIELGIASGAQAWPHEMERPAHRTVANTYNQNYAAHYTSASTGQYTRRGKVEKREGARYDNTAGCWVWPDGEYGLYLGGRWYYWTAEEVEHYWGKDKEEHDRYAMGIKHAYDKCSGWLGPHAVRPFRASTFKNLPVPRAEATCGIAGCTEKEMELHGKTLQWYCTYHADKFEIMYRGMTMKEAQEILTEECVEREARKLDEQSAAKEPIEGPNGAFVLVQPDGLTPLLRDNVITKALQEPGLDTKPEAV